MKKQPEFPVCPNLEVYVVKTTTDSAWNYAEIVFNTIQLGGGARFVFRSVSLDGQVLDSLDLDASVEASRIEYWVERQVEEGFLYISRFQLEKYGQEKIESVVMFLHS